MPHDPYAPPRSDIGDGGPPSEGEEEPRPRRVVAAIAILWAVVGLGIADMAFVLSPLVGIAFAVMLVFGITVTAIYAIVIWMAWRRHDWARWVLLTWLVVGIIALAGPPAVEPEPVAHIVVATIEHVLEAIAVAMLFTRPSRKWFRALT